MHSARKFRFANWPQGSKEWSILQQTGFLNREELHNVELASIQANSKVSDVGFFKIGKWVWNPKNKQSRSWGEIRAYKSVSDPMPL